MDCPAGNQAYIYKNVNDNFSRDNVSAVLSHQGENKRFFSYHSSPGTEIAALWITVNHTNKIIIYKGENADRTPITEIATKTDIDENIGMPFLFDPTEFGTAIGDNVNKLVIGLVQDGMRDPNIEKIDFHSIGIEFPDGFFDKIVPSRTDRGGGVIELADGTLVQYKGYGGNRWRWKLGAKFVKKEMLDRLDALYAERPEFLFAQEPDRYSNRVHRCVLESPIFRIPYTTEWKENGYSIEMEIAQV